MCMSSVYHIVGEERRLILDYVKEARVEGDSVRLFDVLGKETLVKGVLRVIDLVKNEMSIETPESL